MNYGSSYYGLRAFDQTTGVVHDASASASVTSSTAPVGWIVTLGSGQITGTATSSATASAEQFVLQLSSEYSYGTSGYGAHAYGVADLEFGTAATSGASTDGNEVRVRTASATCSATASNSASARRVPEGSALVYGTSLNTVTSDANGTRIRTSPQLATASGSTSSDSTRVRESDSAISATATSVSDSVFIVSASGSLDATTTSVCDPAATFASSGALSANSSSASSADRVLDCSTVFTSPESTLVCDPAATFAGSATPTGTASTTAKAGYVKRSTVNVQCVLTIEANARYKYEQIAKDNETWNDVSASGGTWTEVA